MTSKPSNPKDSVGVKKVATSCLPTGPMLEAALGMLEGGRKYGRHNYRSIGVRSSVYYDATIRHLASWWEGEDIDPDSGLPHVSKAIASLLVLRDAQIMGMEEDDRPPRMPEGWLKELNKKAAEIVDKYPEAARTYTEQERSA